MSDPFSPIPEVRKMNHRHVVDEYNEQWVMIDGIETKVANLEAAKKLLTRQDSVRVQIRADLDELGIRDQTVLEEITLEDGTKTTVAMLPLGASCLQFDMTRKAAATPDEGTPSKSESKSTLWQRVKGLFQ